MNWKRTVSSVLRGMKKSSNVKGKPVFQPITIQDLPDDIILEIFSYLSSDYYKVTSLVCRRWNSVTFGTNQVQLNVTVLNRDRSTEKAYLRLLSKSKRRYKSLKLADCQRSLVLKLLPQFSSNLNSLTLSCNFELKHLPKILQHTSNLRTLDIKFRNFDRTSKKSNILPPLPNLQTLKVGITFLHHPEVNLRQLVPNLTSLTLPFSEDLPVPQPILDFTSPRLRELDLQVNFPHEPTSHFHQIWHAKFPELKRFAANLSTFPVLRTVTIFCDRFADYNNPNQHPEVVSGSLRTLTVTAELTDEILHRLVEFFPNLTTLKMRRIGRCTPEGVLKTRELVPNCCFELPSN